MTAAPLKQITSQLGQALTKLRPLFWAAALVLVALGFDFKTPSGQFSSLRADVNRLDSVDTHLQQDVDALHVQNNDIVDLVTSLARGACLDRQPRETQLMGLDCPTLLHTSGNSTITTTTTRRDGGTITRTTRPNN